MQSFIEKNRDRLKELFKNVYFITGTATGGKTTMSNMIAEKYGFIRYDVDREFDKHQKLSNEIDQPAMNKKFKDADEFFLRDKNEYITWLNQNTKEQMDFILQDIAELSKDNIVVCDIHLSVEEARLLSDVNHVIFLIRENNDNVMDDYISRKSHLGFKRFICTSSNVEKAKKNCNEVLKIINDEKCKAIKESEFKYIERNSLSTIEKTLQIIEKQFGLTKNDIETKNGIRR